LYLQGGSPIIFWIKRQCCGPRAEISCLFREKTRAVLLLIKEKRKEEGKDKKNFKNFAKNLDKELQPCYNMAALEKWGGEHIFPAHTTKNFYGGIEQ